MCRVIEQEIHHGPMQGNEVRRELLDCVLAWKKSLSEGSQPDSKSVGSWSPELAQWLADLRQQSLQVSLPEEVSQTDFRRLSELLHTLNLGSISPKNVLLVCLAGSRLYDLALPSSDKDYIVVFRQPTRDLLASIAQLTVSSWLGLWSHVERWLTDTERAGRTGAE